MQTLHHLLLITSLLLGQLLAAQPLLTDVPKAFAAISDQPKARHFTSNLSVPKGGHLQGIQVIASGAGRNLVLTASSGSYAYYVNATIDDTVGKALYTRKISDSPYRHAGGCQSSAAILAVGVEDNLRKDKSKVVLLSNDTTTQPITIAERSGAFERSTAGATGIVRMKDNRYLVAVADWDSRNIDLYISQANNVARFDSVNTFNSTGQAIWGSYQSINLLSNDKGNIYMIGFCKEGSKNRADLFVINMDAKVSLTHIASRYFKSNHAVSFRYGAGIQVAANNQLMLLSCARTLKKVTYYNVWQ